MTKNNKSLDAFELELMRQQCSQQEELEDAFDNKRMAEQWGAIANQLGEEKLPTEKQEKVVPIRYLWRVAAGLTGLLLLTWGYHFYRIQEKNISTIAAEQSFLPAELQEAEQASFAMLRQDMQTLKARDTAQWIAPHTLQALAELEEAYKEMKEDLLEDQNARVLIDEMLANLRLRHQILNESVRELERIQQHSKEQLNYREL